ncbi:hypothetical protein B0H10DRAFT_1944717 [Mycena sp. CBHHK59/15]|nr:hypothetical protein B0H10DRAFT_1944717 [Mycena sp. CBHHK59/15]
MCIEVANWLATNQVSGPNVHIHVVHPFANCIQAAPVYGISIPPSDLSLLVVKSTLEVMLQDQVGRVEIQLNPHVRPKGKGFEIQRPLGFSTEMSGLCKGFGYHISWKQIPAWKFVTLETLFGGLENDTKVHTRRLLAQCLKAWENQIKGLWDSENPI